MQKTLGGDRLGSGKKMKVDLHGYERSTHDKGYIWRSTMAAGTLVPFLNEIALPGDTFDINLDCDIKTHPTIGPLFGSYKVQLDIFQAPIRLYHAKLHNNALGIGMNMGQIFLPKFTLKVFPMEDPDAETIDTLQINPSCLLAYLGLKGIGLNLTEEQKDRSFNAVPLIAYWDIYKNYYSNKQEELGAFINTPLPPRTITSITADAVTIVQAPATGLTGPLTIGDDIIVNFTGTAPQPQNILFNINGGWGARPLTEVLDNIVVGGATITGDWNLSNTASIINWDYAQNEFIEPIVDMFPLENIDHMREKILQNTNPTFLVNDLSEAPYEQITDVITATVNGLLATQQGLAVKTYQSDLFNNWLQTEWIDGAGGITELTSIDTSGGSFSIDTLNLSKKVYDMLNRIAVSGGTYDDWLDAVYAHDRYTRCETPMYMGGLSKELIFQEVVSNSESETEEGTQPLGTLAGKGILAKKHKGGHVTVKVDEPSYIMGIISLTPRIDYSQGNNWDVHLNTMDDLHKPALDEIGFQELITEQMAWWTTSNDGTQWNQKSVGKQPAWINYMTNVNKTYGNFAIPTSEMFMTLNRRYEFNTPADPDIKDLTTYIDPVKFNHIFAQTSRDAQNFWAQIAVDITARRKMSAKIMPNL